MRFSPKKRRCPADFWEDVDRSGGPDACWPWTRGRDRDGYGRLGPHPWGSNRASRVAWIIEHGPIPKGLEVLHTCDNPPCCNPAHLFLGTTQDNTADMIAKGRIAVRCGDNHHARAHPELIPRGERHGLAKLSTQDALELIRLRRFGLTYRELGERFGITPPQACAIVKGRSWKHLKDSA